MPHFKGRADHVAELCAAVNYAEAKPEQINPMTIPHLDLDLGKRVSGKPQIVE